MKICYSQLWKLYKIFELYFCRYCSSLPCVYTCATIVATIKMQKIICIFLLFAIILSIFISSVFSLDLKTLRYYEFISSESIIEDHHYNYHKTKRSVDPCKKTMAISALGKNFQLNLWCQQGLFSNDFNLNFSHSSTDDSLINERNFWEGYVVGEDDKSHVTAYWEGKSLSATIVMANDTYVVEPAWRHFSSTDQNKTMIAYRLSDMSGLPGKSGGKFCDADIFNTTSHHDSMDWKNEESVVIQMHHRVRRAADDGHNTCRLLLVCDYSFFQTIANNDKATAVNYMIGRIQQVDAIYRKTNWNPQGDSLTNLGVEIAGILVNEQPTNINGHYNMKTDRWSSANDLLTAFTSASDLQLKTYCIAHLFHAHSFSEGTLGLAYIASSQANQPGGICSSRGNTGWTSALDQNGQQLLTLQATLVTAHEIGHNWGSVHDPAQCQPGDNGGNYIMYAYSVTGLDPNNNLFSDCSKGNILAVLNAKMTSCFTPQRTSTCGNGIVEASEKCDGGSQMINGIDPCCDTKCNFKSNASCSDFNQICCNNCQLASKTKICHNADLSNITCADTTFCDGVHYECPSTISKPDGTPCINNGNCYNGTCLSVCKSKGLSSCVCNTAENSCYVCCRDSSGSCSVYTENRGKIALQDGQPCVSGYCQAGNCKTVTINWSERLWDVIQHLTPNEILIFMQNNIVLATIILSLIVYLPICIIVCIIDCVHDRKDKKLTAWHSKDNENLILKTDEGRVKHSTGIKYRPLHADN